MRRSLGVSYLVALSVSLGLLAIVAIDAMRRSPNDQPAAAQRKPSQGPGVTAQRTPILAVAAPAVDGSAPPVSAPAPVTPPSQPGPAHPAPKDVSVSAWPSAMVQVSTVAGRAAVPLPRDSGVPEKSCLARWDRDTHMTKAEWKAACQRTPGR